MTRILFWRWPLLALVLVLVVTESPTWKWGFATAFAILACQLGLHLFEPERMRLWLARGRLYGADAAVVGLALLGAAAVPALGRGRR